jgi:hypothetical protein
MMTIAGRFVIEADDDPWLFVGVVCTISVSMIRASEDDVGASR